MYWSMRDPRDVRKMLKDWAKENDRSLDIIHGGPGIGAITKPRPRHEGDWDTSECGINPNYKNPDFWWTFEEVRENAEQISEEARNADPIRYDLVYEVDVDTWPCKNDDECGGDKVCWYNAHEWYKRWECKSPSVET